MKILKTIDALSAWRASQDDNRGVGFVPTMGALHEGHLMLVSQAMKDHATAIVSIYVNPTQFNQAEDLAAYPVDIEGDIRLLESIGCPALFLPDHASMYPGGVQAESFDLGGLDGQLEGKLRPGHFQGVATIVNRLFDMVQPTHAYFGWKDFQQVKIIQKLAELRGGTPAIMPQPIVRAEDGLALSSRNRRLSPAQLQAAPALFKVLDQIKRSSGSATANDWRNRVGQTLGSTGELDLEDLEFVNAHTLELIPADVPLKDCRGPIQLLIAAYAGDIRLIDNDVAEWT